MNTRLFVESFICYEDSAIDGRVIFKVSHIFDLHKLFSILSLDFESFPHFQFPSLISLFVFRMAFEKTLMLLILVSLAIRNANSSTKSFWFEQDVYGNWRTTFDEIEKSNLVWKYAFQNCRQASKIHKASRLLRSRALIIMLLILGCIERHPGPSTSFNVGKFSYIFSV